MTGHGLYRGVIRILVVLGVLWAITVVCRFVCSRADYNAVLRGSRPSFSRQTSSTFDGTNLSYQGLGYSLNSVNRLHVEDGPDAGYYSGAILEYRLNWLLLPLEDKQSIRFQPESLGVPADDSQEEEE